MNVGFEYFARINPSSAKKSSKVESESDFMLASASPSGFVIS